MKLFDQYKSVYKYIHIHNTDIYKYVYRITHVCARVFVCK